MIEEPPPPPPPPEPEPPPSADENRLQLQRFLEEANELTKRRIRLLKYSQAERDRENASKSDLSLISALSSIRNSPSTKSRSQVPRDVSSESDIEDTSYLTPRRLDTYLRRKWKYYDIRENENLRRLLYPPLTNRYYMELPQRFRKSWTLPILPPKRVVKSRIDFKDAGENSSCVFETIAEVENVPPIIEPSAGSNHNRRRSILYFIFGAAFGIALAFSIIYLIYINNLLGLIFKPLEPPESTFNYLSKYVGRSLHNCFETVLSVFAYFIPNIENG